MRSEGFHTKNLSVVLTHTLCLGVGTLWASANNAKFKVGIRPLSLTHGWVALSVPTSGLVGELCMTGFSDTIIALAPDIKAV